MLGKPLHGKGLWIRRIIECEAGDLERIATRAQAAGFTHVILKIADGADPYNVERTTYGDAAAELIRHLRAAGIDVWGWHPVYGDRPRFKGAFQADYHLREAEEALHRVDELDDAGLQGYVVNAQGDYERCPHRAQKAAQFMETVRAGLRDFPIALASWKNPKAHPHFPWQEFRSFCDLDLPQVFWIGTYGEVARQLEAAVRQFAMLTPRLPCVPTGPAFFESDWRPSPDELVEFFETAIALGLRAANLWDLDQLALGGDEPYNPKRLDFTAHWEAVARFVWREPEAEPEWMRFPEYETIAAIERAFGEPAPAPPPTSVRAAEPEAAAEVEAVELAPEPEAEAAPEAEPVAAPATPLARVSHTELPTWLQTELARVHATEAEAASPVVEEYAVEPEEAIEPEAEAELPEHLQFLHHPELADAIEIYGAPGGRGEPGVRPEPPLFLMEPETERRLSALVEIPPVQATSEPPLFVTGEFEHEVEPGLDLQLESAEDLPEHLQFLHHPELADAIEVYGAPGSRGEPGVRPEPPFFVMEPEAERALAAAAEPPLFITGDYEYELEPDFALDLEPGDDLPEWLQFLDHPELADDMEIVAPLQAELDALASEEDTFRRVTEWVEPELDAMRFVVEPEPEPELEPVFYELELADALEFQLEPEDDLPEHLQFLNNPDLADAIQLAAPSPPMPESAPEPAALAQPMAAAPVEEPAALEEELVAMPEWVHLPSAIAQAEPEQPSEAALAEILPVPSEPAPLPDWLPLAKGEIAHAEEPAPAPPSERTAAPAPEAGPMPDWLAQADAELAHAAEPLPDWLTQAEADLIRAEEPETAPAPAPAATSQPEGEELPDWLAQADAELARAGAAEPGMGEFGVRPEPVMTAPVEQTAAPSQPELAISIRPVPVPAPAPIPEPSPIPVAEGDIVGRLFAALRRGRLDEALSLYGPSFALVSAERVVRDPESARAFYQTMLQRLEGRTLSLLSQRGTRVAVRARWASRQKDGTSVQGADTFHLNRQGQIVYHQTTFRTE